MRTYKVGLEDLKFLVEGFVDGMYFTRKGAVNWCRENKEIITPEFMKRVRASPDGFFYYESHLREDSYFKNSCLEGFLEDLIMC